MRLKRLFKENAQLPSWIF